MYLSVKIEGMRKKKFMLRFEGKQQPMSAEDGLSLEVFGNMMASLIEAVELATSTEGVVALKQLHRHLSQGRVVPKAQKYAKMLNKVVETGIQIEVYDGDSKALFARISKIAGLDTERYYYDYEEITGTITEIGAKTLSAQCHIKIQEHNYSIAITPEQDQALRHYYRHGKLLLYVRTKHSYNQKKIKSVELVSFEPKGTQTLIEASEAFISKHGNAFGDGFDAVEAIHKLRMG